MSKMKVLCAISALAVACCAGCGAEEKKPSENAVTPTVTLQPSATPAPVDSNPQDSITPTPEPTKEAEISVTPVPTATDTPTPEPTKAVDENGMAYKCPPEYLKKRDDVTYPAFAHETYYSDYCKRERGVNVMLPATYSPDKKYPVVYLLHGIFGDENSFAGDKNLPVLIGNLVADGLTEEFILVCPAMFAASDETAQAPGFTAAQMIPYDNFAHELTKSLIPYINGKYSVIEGREGTYLAGFSMGGRETLYTSLTYPDAFRSICAIAPAPGIVPGKDNYMVHEGSLTEDQVVYPEGSARPDKIIICCGTKDSVVGKFPKSYHELYEKNGIAHYWYEIPGADHDMNAQYSGLYNFLQLIGK